jgi:serine protease
MYRRRLPIFFLSISLIIASLATLGGQSGVDAERDYVVGLGLPGIDRGVNMDASHMPAAGEPLTRRRAIQSRAVVADRVGPAGSRVVAGRVIVKFREGVSVEMRQSAIAAVSAGATLAPRQTYANFDIAQLDMRDDSERVARILSERADVEYAQPAHRFHAQNFVPNDPLYRSMQWNLTLIDMERAWDIQPQAGSSITVAVIDTGVAYTNATLIATIPAFTLDGIRYPALGRQTMPISSAPQLAPSSRFVAPKTFLSSCGENGPCVPVCTSDPPVDLAGHGTHVSGTIGQTTNDNVGTAGVAFNVKIMPIKVLSDVWDVLVGCGDDLGGTDDDVAQGIRYAADNGAKVINMSLGGTGPAGSSPVIEDAMRYAIGKGVFIAVAGGNGFEDGNDLEVVAEIASRLSGAVSVAAVDPQKKRAFYSTTGSFIELAAPGGSTRGFGQSGAVWQQTLDSNFADTYLLSPSRFVAPRFDVFAYEGCGLAGCFQGTSMATPHVAGLAAMLMQQGITSPSAIEAALERFAVDLGAPGRDPEYGFGLVEARDVLRGLGLAR